MGYRHYLYLVEKTKLDEIKDLEELPFKEKFCDTLLDYENAHFPDIYLMLSNVLENIGGKCIYELGKLYWDDTAEKMRTLGKPLFTKESLQKYYEEDDVSLHGAELLPMLIDVYKNKMIAYYQELLKTPEEMITPDKRSVSDKCIFEVQEKLRGFKNMVNLDLKKENITDSWMYEYVIFEFVRLYKTIDFEKYAIVVLAW